MTQVTPTAPHIPEHPVLARLTGVIASDRVFNDILGDGLLRSNFQKVTPSGLDTVAAAAARAVLAAPRSVAIAAPRGLSPLPAMLGMYLALSRVVIGKLAGGICGSVAVSTTRTDLREVARHLAFPDELLVDVIRVARLVTEPVGPTKVRAAALTLDRTTRKGLSQNDAFLLFMLPNRMPPVALNVISVMVCDTYGASETSWNTTHERNVAAHRREVWLGELGDDDYERFCAERNIPLLRLDWPLIADATRSYGTGNSHLASSAASRRALDAPTIGYHVITDATVDEELRELTFALAQMRRRGREDPPDAVRFAGQLANLLTRLACPVASYDRAVASHPMSRRAQWLLERVTDAGSATFRNRYKQAFEQHWTTVKGAAKELMRTLSDPEQCPKYWAVQERVLRALDDGEPLRVLCQTRAERDALRDALLDGELVTPEDLNGGRVTIASFSERAPQGPVAGAVTLLCAPPPPGKSALYLSGEAGHVEVLCYPFEVGRLRAGVRRAHADYAADTAALTALSWGGPVNGHHPPDPPDPDALLEELDGYGSSGAPRDGEDEAPDVTLPDADAGFWESAAGLYDTELPLEDGRDPAAAGGEHGEHGIARLVRFIDGPPMYLAEDAHCTVVVAPQHGEEPDIMSVPPASLERGMRIAVLPGSERGGLLAELMDAWDEGITLVRARYEPMFYRALDAVEQHGIRGVAEAVGLTRRAVQLWYERWNWPGSATSLRRLLEFSGDEEAIRNQALIQDLFSRIRGAHRYIGRVLNDAVGETVLHDISGRDSIAKLEALVGRDLTDLFDATSVLTVASVGDPEKVPAGVLGSFLDRDDPYLTAKGATL